MPVTRSARLAVAGVAVAVALMVAVAALGPSVVQAPLPRGGAWPPWDLRAAPPDLLVSGLLAAAVVAGAVGLGAGLHALRRGWRPSPRRLVAAGLLAVVALLLVPPTGDADLESYAAYGRIAATGGNPYRETPLDLAARGDPVGKAVEPPWQDTSSVYGPVATGVQAGVAAASGSSVRTGVLLDRLVAAAAFVAAGLLLQRVLRSDDGRRRAAWLWSLNPLLLQGVVLGGHVDALAVAFGVAGLACAAAAPATAGLLVGVGALVKLPVAAYALGGGWALRRRPRALAALAAATAATVVAGYALAPSGAVAPLRRASRMVAPVSPWRTVSSALDRALPWSTARTLTGLAAGLVALALAWGLARRHRDGLTGGSPTGQAATATAVLAVAWLLTGTYILPWYDTLGWGALALAAASGLDWLLLAQGAVLSLAFVPGRDVSLGGTAQVVREVVHSGVTPAVLAVVVVAAVVPRPGRPARSRAA